MSDSVDHEIRALQSIYWSARDPDGLAFAPLADALRRKGDIREALDLLSDGTSRHPDFSTGHVVTAQLYSDWGMSAEAELAARHALDLDPENIVALSILGSILVERGDAEAGVVHAALVDADPDSDQARALSEQDETEVHAEASQPVAVDEEVAHSELDELTRTEELLGEPVLSLDELGPSLADEVVDAPGLDASDVSLDDVDQDAPTVERLAIHPDASADESFEDALGLTSDPFVGLEPGPESEALEASLDMLNPDESEPAAEAAEEAMGLGALAPDAEPEPVVEEAMDLGALAPDPEPEAVTEDVMDLGALAPDPEPEPVADVMDLGALAPDPEPEAVTEDVMDLGALAPGPEPEAVTEDVMDLGALAPDPEPEPVAEDVMDLGALAPDPEPEAVTEDVMDLGALAPDPEPVAEDVMDLGALAPDPNALAAAALEPADPTEEDPHVDSSEPVSTRTLAELYVSQGFTDKAIDVYRQLQAAEPEAEDLERRIAELEGRAPAEAEATRDETAPAGDVSEHADVKRAPDEEVETLARDLAEAGTDDHEVDTPFAWSEGAVDEKPAAVADGTTIGAYFDQLLGWEEDEG